MKKLFKILKIIGYVNSNKWKTVMNIVDHIPNSKIVKKEWVDWEYKNDNPEYYPLDLSKIKTWSTYEKCIDLEFENKNNKLHCYVKIYNGNSFDGMRSDLRFTAEIILPNKFIICLKDEIENSFNIYCDDKYDDYLEQQRNEWINEFKKKLVYSKIEK